MASAAHRVAEDVLGAAKDGSVKVFIVAKDLAFHRGKRRSSRGGGRIGRREGGSVKVFIVAQDLAFWGPGGARPLRHATTTTAAVFAQLAIC